MTAYNEFNYDPETEYNSLDDEALLERERQMQRKLLKLKLQAFDKNQATLDKQLAIANNLGPRGMKLHGIPMTAGGLPVRGPEEVAATQLRDNLNNQLELLVAGKTVLPGYSMIDSILPSREALKGAGGYKKQLLELLLGGGDK